jgi:hypothetical protein
MIVSHKYKFIFIHIPKTGGTSIERWFGRHAGEDDHVYETDTFKKHLSARMMKEQFSELGWEDKWDEYFKFVIIRNPWDIIHSDYYFVKSISEQIVQRYYVLEPDSHVGTFKEKWVEKCKWIQDNNPTFEEFFRRFYYNNHNISFFQQYARDGMGNDLVDFVCNQETLDKDFSVVCKKLGIDDDILPLCNVTQDHMGGLSRPPYQSEYGTKVQV